jgi:hypothetical protein
MVCLTHKIPDRLECAVTMGKRVDAEPFAQPDLREKPRRPVSSMLSDRSPVR